MRPHRRTYEYFTQLYRTILPQHFSHVKRLKKKNTHTHKYFSKCSYESEKVGNSYFMYWEKLNYNQSHLLTSGSIWFVRYRRFFSIGSREALTSKWSLRSWIIQVYTYVSAWFTGPVIRCWSVIEYVWRAARSYIKLSDCGTSPWCADEDYPDNGSRPIFQLFVRFRYNDIFWIVQVTRNKVVTLVIVIIEWIIIFGMFIYQIPMLVSSVMKTSDSENGVVVQKRECQCS